MSAIIQHNVLVTNIVDLGKQTGDSYIFCCAVSRQETSRILDLVQSAANSNQATGDTSWTATQGFPCASVSNFKCVTPSYAKASLAWVPCHSLLCTCSAALKVFSSLASQRPCKWNFQSHACLWPCIYPVGVVFIFVFLFLIVIASCSNFTHACPNTAAIK